MKKALVLSIVAALCSSVAFADDAADRLERSAPKDKSLSAGQIAQMAIGSWEIYSSYPVINGAVTESSRLRKLTVAEIEKLGPGTLGKLKTLSILKGVGGVLLFVDGSYRIQKAAQGKTPVFFPFTTDTSLASVRDPSVSTAAKKDVHESGNHFFAVIEAPAVLAGAAK